MRQYLLFAGRSDTNAAGVHGFINDFDTFAEAFVSLVDRQTPSDWWHILDTQSGEVVEHQHLKVHNGMIGFERSHWVVGHPRKEEPVAVPAPALEALSQPKLPEIDSIEADLRSVLKGGLRDNLARSANGKARDHANGAAEH